MSQARQQLPDIVYCDDAYAAAEGAEALVIATEWEQFRALDLKRLRRIMLRPAIVDLRNVYRADEMRRAKFRYVGVGGRGGFGNAPKKASRDQRRLRERHLFRLNRQTLCDFGERGPCGPAAASPATIDLK